MMSWLVITTEVIWMFPKIGVPQNGLLIMDPIKMDDLEGPPLFLETPIYSTPFPTEIISSMSLPIVRLSSSRPPHGT